MAERFDSDELGREVSRDEVRLWEEVRRRDRSGPYDTIRAVEAGRQVGLHESRARQIVRTWTNDGLVRQVRDYNMCKLTTYGRGFDFDG